MNSGGHLAEFFRTDEQLIGGVVDFLQEGFERSCACIAVVTPQHRARIAAVLADRGFSEHELIGAYRYIVLDALDTLNSVRRDGGFDVAEFHRSFGQLLSLAASGGRDVRIVGEMVTLLARKGDGRAVIQLEEIWNDLSRLHPFTLFCPYPLEVFESTLDKDHLAQVRALHSHASQAA